ncbi:MAG: IclR family transcriptional regulator [Actinomycetia bacterium]|nr:IclR family transcriptional regulator [Actinomycetes bacterium]
MNTVCVGRGRHEAGVPAACGRSLVVLMPAIPGRADPYQVKVLDKAIDILDAFTVHRADLSIPQIVEATGLNRSTAIRLVANLERRGLLQRVPATRRYRLGRRLFEMGSIVYSSLSLVEAAAGPLSALERRSGATIVLAVRSGDYSVTVDRRQGVGNGSTMVPVPGEVGTVRPLTYGPIGQVLMAALDPETVENILDRYPLEQYTPYSILDRDRFLERLPLVRTQGYALDVNEVVEGLMGVAAPILDFTGNIAGVLSLGFPSTRENDRDFLDDAVRDLKRAVAEISANMGYTGGADADGAYADGTDADGTE